MEARRARRIFCVVLVASLAGLDCSSSEHTLPTGGSSPSPNENGPMSPPVACGVPCSDSSSCGPGLACLPSAKGGSVCKPSTCPSCGPGKFCAFNTNTCEPTGCTSASCGFNNVGACDDCFHANCCAQGSACAGDPGCQAIVDCAGHCGADGACAQSCVGQGTPAAQALYLAMAGCYHGRCQAACFPDDPPATTPPGGGSPGPGGGSPPPGQVTCAQSCPTNTLCVNLNGVGSCVTTCSSNSDCASGCCGGLAGTTVRACLPASNCGSPGGGATCTNLTTCVSVTYRNAANGTSCTGAEIYATVTNNCGQAAHCRVCPVVNGSVYEAGCGASDIAPGTTQSGESGGWWWCEGDQVKYRCSSPGDSQSCVDF